MESILNFIFVVQQILVKKRLKSKNTDAKKKMMSSKKSHSLQKLDKDSIHENFQMGFNLRQFVKLFECKLITANHSMFSVNRTYRMIPHYFVIVFGIISISLFSQPIRFLDLRSISMSQFSNKSYSQHGCIEKPEKTLWLSKTIIFPFNNGGTQQKSEFKNFLCTNSKSALNKKNLKLNFKVAHPSQASLAFINQVAVPKDIYSSIVFYKDEDIKNDQWELAYSTKNKNNVLKGNSLT